MHPTPLLLQQTLSLAALVAAALEYAIIVRHRTARRATATQVAEAQAAGLRSLVRVLLVDDAAERPPKPLA
jgi:hypothetical protein